MALSLLLAGCRGRDADLPAAYRRLEIPKARLASASARERGRALFLKHCALCHGVNADGHGVRREGFQTPPANFTDVGWQRRTTTRRIFFAIREGVHGTAMPSWRVALEPGETWDLVAYLRSVEQGAP